MQFSELCQTYGIALTGGIAAGKSTISEILRAMGYIVIDADQVSRLVVLPGTEGLKEIVANFGIKILNAEGALDRARMRALVFESVPYRQQLEQIIHRRLGAATAELLVSAGVNDNPRHWFYEASLIYERERAQDFREVWVAFCPEERQLSRLMARDHCDLAQAKSIIAAQMPVALKVQRADRTIDSDCDLGELEKRVERTLTSLIAKEAKT